MNNKKLREDLANLFKCHGDSTVNKKNAKSFTREQEKSSKAKVAEKNEKIIIKKSMKGNDINKNKGQKTQNENIKRTATVANDNKKTKKNKVELKDAQSNKKVANKKTVNIKQQKTEILGKKTVKSETEKINSNSTAAQNKQKFPLRPQNADNVKSLKLNGKNQQPNSVQTNKHKKSNLKKTNKDSGTSPTQQKIPLRPQNVDSKKRQQTNGVQTYKNSKKSIKSNLKKTNSDNETSQTQQKFPLRPQYEDDDMKVDSKKRKAVKVKGPKPKKSKPDNDMHMVEFKKSSNESEDESSDGSCFDLDFDTSESDYDEEETSQDDYEAVQDYSSDSDDYEEEDSDDDSDDFYTSSDDSFKEYTDDDDDIDFFHHDIEMDPDYELPKGELEDLVIHKGLAVKYNLEAHHDVEFDENIESAQIVELSNQMPVNTVKQLPEYGWEQLRNLERRFVERLTNLVEKKDDDDVEDSADDCPKLVPIDDYDFVNEDEDEDEEDDEFKLWTSGVTMDDEMFSDCETVEDESDESSVLSYSDVNRKYLKRSQSYESSDYEDEDEDEQQNVMRADIIDGVDTESVAEYWSATSDATADSTSFLSLLLQNCFEIDEDVNAEFIDAKVLDNFNDEDEEASVLEFEQQKQSQVQHQNGAPKPKVYELPNDSSSEMDVDSVGEVEKGDGNGLVQLQLQLPEDINEISYFSPQQQYLNADFYNSIDSYHVLVLLKSAFYLYGTLKATIVAGSVEIYGYKPKIGETVTVHSPRGCSAVQIKPIFDTSTLKSAEDANSIKKRIDDYQNIAEFNESDVKKLLNNYEPKSCAILMLARNEGAEKLKQMFQQHISENIYPPHIPRSRSLHSSETVLDCMINPTAEYALQLPQSWTDLRLESNSKLMLIGGKAVGKSTLVRYMLNRHLASYPRILLIDLDIGQPEVFVPQTVSCTLLEKPLLGPGFFWQCQPDKAYAVGQTNLVLCAHTYMHAVMDLLEFCHTETKYQNIPWLINTMGYNKGFGAELISVICEHLQPTDIVQLQSNKPINNFEYIFEPNIVPNIPRILFNTSEYETRLGSYMPNYRLKLLPSAIQQQSRYQREWQMSAKDMRYIMLLARLSTVLPNDGEFLNRSETFCCSFDDLKIINLNSKDADEMETLRALNSNLVYLCHISLNAEDSNSTDTVQCFGIGILRGIDYTLKNVYIIPAMPVKNLSTVNCLALGEMPLPASLLTAQDPDSESKIPYVQVMNDEATSRAIKQFYYRT